MSYRFINENFLRGDKTDKYLVAYGKLNQRRKLGKPIEVQ